MSIDSSLLPSKSTRMDGLLDWMQMLSGVGLVLFMLVHVLLVSSVIVSPEWMNGISEALESTGLAQIGGPLIFALLIVHFILAARKLPFRIEGQKTIWAHARMMHHADTWLWVVQAVSAMFILVMGSIHLWTVLTDMPLTAQKSAEQLQGGISWPLFYLFFVPLVWLHWGAGIYRIGVKWGFVKDIDRSRFRKTLILVTLGLIGLGLLSQIRLAFLAVQ